MIKKSWHAYYRKHRSRLTDILLHYEYLARVAACRPRRLLEIGCGPAHHILFLKKMGLAREIYVLDQDQQILETLHARAGKKITAIYHLDLLNKEDRKRWLSPHFDVIMSQGLFEHFRDEDFITLADALRQKTRRMIASVPAETYPSREFGNEHLRSRAEITALLRRVPAVKFKVKPYWDIGLRTKLLTIKKNRWSFFKAGTFIFTGANHCLIDVTYL